MAIGNEIQTDGSPQFKCEITRVDRQLILRRQRGASFLDIYRVVFPPNYFVDPESHFIRKLCNNRPFPSSLVPLFQSESKCETILMKMTLICMKMNLYTELIFI